MSGNRGCPAGFELRPGHGAAHPLMEAYARIDELEGQLAYALDTVEAAARIALREAREKAAANVAVSDLRAAVARALAGLQLCDDPECDPCSLEQANCAVLGDAAEEFLAVLPVLGLELRRARPPADEWAWDAYAAALREEGPC